MASLAFRKTMRMLTSDHTNDKGENKYLNKSNDFDEWCKLNRRRLIKLFADDVSTSKEVIVESMYNKVYEICESRFPQLKKDPLEDGLDCMGLIQHVFNIAYSDQLISPDFVLGNYHSLLVRANWFFNLYKSKDVDYLSKVVEALKKETEDSDSFKHYIQGIKKVHSDLTTIIAKVELEIALPSKETIKKKTNKI